MSRSCTLRVSFVAKLVIDDASDVGRFLEDSVRGMSSSSAPISSARSTTALLELPRSSCSPRVKYAVVANIITKPITRESVRTMQMIDDNYESYGKRQ